MRTLVSPDRGALFCTHVVLRHPLHWRGDPVEAIDPLALVAGATPAAAVIITYQERSSALFVTDPALPEMDDLHHTWQKEVRRLADASH
ncbi:hypothetical protein HRW23_36295 [Streptomyces lunaelactis]|nr:hypothetical protein [Streptomyces lunaelactis]